MGLGFITPILPKLVTQLLGDDVSTASYYFGAIATTYALMLFVFSPIQGILSDRFGRKPLLLFSLLGTGLSYLTSAFAPNLAWIFVAQIVNGITGGSISVVASYIADVSSLENRAKNFNLIGATLGAGFVIGPALGGLLGTWGLRTPFLVAFAIALLNLMYGIKVLPETHSPEHRRPFSWSSANPLKSLLLLRKTPVIFGLAAVILCNELATQCFLSTWVLFTTYKFQWTTAQAGLSFALLGLVTIVVQITAIRIVISRFGERKTILAGLAFGFVSYLLYGLAPRAWMMYPIIAVHSFDFVVRPTAQGLISSQVSSLEQGAIQGALTSVTALSNIIGPLLATNLFGYFTSAGALVHLPGVAFFLGDFFFVLALWLANTTFSKQSLQNKPPSARV